MEAHSHPISHSRPRCCPSPRDMTRCVRPLLWWPELENLSFRFGTFVHFSLHFGSKSQLGTKCCRNPSCFATKHHCVTCAIAFSKPHSHLIYLALVLGGQSPGAWIDEARNRYQTNTHTQAAPWLFTFFGNFLMLYHDKMGQISPRNRAHWLLSGSSFHAEDDGWSLR